MKILQNPLNAVNAGPFGHKRAINHNHWQAQLARRVNLRPRARTARVLGDDMGDVVRLQQVKIALQCKRAARDQGCGLGQGQGCGVIDQPQMVMRLRLYGEIFQVLSPDGQEHPGGIIGQCRDRTRHVGHKMPKVALRCLPRGAFKGDKRGFRQGCGLHRVATDLGGEGMGGVDQVGNGSLLQVIHQPRHPAKAANTLRKRLAQGRLGAARVGKDRVNPLIGQGFRQIRRLGRAAKQKDAGHG